MDFDSVNNNSDTLYQGGYFRESDNSWAVKNWIPAVNSRWKALIQAIGTRYNPDPLFEALVFSETVLQKGVSSTYNVGTYGGTPSQNGYNDTAYESVLESNLTQVCPYFVNTLLFQYINRFTDDNGTASGDLTYFMPTLGSFCERKYIGIGGPDIQPPTNQLNFHSDAYGLFTQYKDQIPFAIAGQGPDYAVPKTKDQPGSTAQDLFQFSVGPKDTLSSTKRYYPDTPLNVNYVFWANVNSNGAPVQFCTPGAESSGTDTTTIVGYVNVHKARIKTTKP